MWTVLILTALALLLANQLLHLHLMASAWHEFLASKQKETP